MSPWFFHRSTADWSQHSKRDHPLFIKPHTADILPPQTTVPFFSPLLFKEPREIAIKEAYEQHSPFVLYAELGLKHFCFTNSNTQHGAMVKPPRHINRNKCNWELCRWLSSNLAVFRIWKLIRGRLASLGFRGTLVSDFWDDQKGSPFLHHNRVQQGHSESTQLLLWFCWTLK